MGDSEEAFQQLWPEDRALRPIVFSTADVHFSHFAVIVLCRDVRILRAKNFFETDLSWRPVAYIFRQKICYSQERML